MFTSKIYKEAKTFIDITPAKCYMSTYLTPQLEKKPSQKAVQYSTRGHKDTSTKKISR